MKERGIIFSAPLVRALLEGRKTQTRRIVKAPSITWAPLEPGNPVTFRDSRGNVLDPHTMPCPYGKPGDRLWVRETFAPNYFDGGRHGYRADWTASAADMCPEPRWTPAIHMPRAASRITLEIIAVRVERVQNISEADAKAEGVTPFPYDPEGDCWTDRPDDRKYRSALEYLWGQINGWGGEPRARAPWTENPWVWVIEFRRVQPAERAA